MGRSLKQLVEAAANGDKSAQRDLIESTYRRVFRFALTLCGDKVRAEDLTQEAYLKALNHLTKIEKTEAFIDWLFRVTRHLFIDEIRRQKNTVLEAAPEAAVNPELTQILAVHATLAQFEAEDRWLLLLVDLENYSYRDAAKMLEVSEATVRSRLFRLRKNFVEKWRGDETK